MIAAGASHTLHGEPIVDWQQLMAQCHLIAFHMHPLTAVQSKHEAIAVARDVIISALAAEGLPERVDVYTKRQRSSHRHSCCLCSPFCRFLAVIREDTCSPHVCQLVQSGKASLGMLQALQRSRSRHKHCCLALKHIIPGA